MFGIIASSRAEYAGYCRFGFLLPRGDEALSLDEWFPRGRIDSRTVTAYYAGMLATAYYCASYGGEDDYPEGSEQDDLEKIQTLLRRPSPPSRHEICGSREWRRHPSRSSLDSETRPRLPFITSHPALFTACQTCTV